MIGNQQATPVGSGSISDLLQQIQNAGTGAQNWTPAGAQDPNNMVKIDDGLYTGGAPTGPPAPGSDAPNQSDVLYMDPTQTAAFFKQLGITPPNNVQAIGQAPVTGKVLTTTNQDTPAPNASNTATDGSGISGTLSQLQQDISQGKTPAGAGSMQAQMAALAALQEQGGGTTAPPGSTTPAPTTTPAPSAPTTNDTTNTPNATTPPKTDPNAPNLFGWGTYMDTTFDASQASGGADAAGGAADFLKRLQYYDPTAHFETVTDSEGNVTGQKIAYDPNNSVFKQYQSGNIEMNPVYSYGTDKGQANRADLFQPGAVGDMGGPFGQFTSEKNFNSSNGATDLGFWGPLAVSLLTGGAGLMAGFGTSSALGAANSFTGIGNSLTSGQDPTAGILGLVGNMTGIPGLGQIASTGYNLARGGTPGAGSIASLIGALSKMGGIGGSP